MLKKKVIKIAIVEDDLYFNKSLTKYIQNICNHEMYPNFDFKITSFLNAHTCIEEIEDDVNLLILDYFLINEEEDDILNGFDVIREVQKCNPDCLILVVSALKEAHTIAELIKSGVYDYVDKNIDSNSRIGSIVQNAMNKLNGNVTSA